MYTKKPPQPGTIPGVPDVVIPEHYSGVAFSGARPGTPAPVYRHEQPSTMAEPHRPPPPTGIRLSPLAGEELYRREEEPAPPHPDEPEVQPEDQIAPEEDRQPEDVASTTPEEKPYEKPHLLAGLLGREELLLLVLALLLLDGESGDETLAYLLLALVFLK